MTNRISSMMNSREATRHVNFAVLATMCTLSWTKADPAVDPEIPAASSVRELTSLWTKKMSAESKESTTAKTQSWQTALLTYRQ